MLKTLVSNLSEVLNMEGFGIRRTHRSPATDRVTGFMSPGGPQSPNLTGEFQKTR